MCDAYSKNGIEVDLIKPWRYSNRNIKIDDIFNKYLKEININKLINILVGLGLVALLVWNPFPFQILELKTFDFLMSTQSKVQNDNILIVDIDEEIIKEYGGYPLPRSLYADLITKTQAVPGITILMPDPDIRGKENDVAFSDMMERVPTVLAYAASTQAVPVLKVTALPPAPEL